MMNYRVRLTLENPTGKQTTASIPQGMLFEVIDPMSRVENMMVDRDYQIQLQPYQRKIIEIECRCSNRPFDPRSDTPLRATPFVGSASLG